MLYGDDLLARLEAGLRTALPSWGLDPATPLRLLSVSENAIFVAGDGDARIVLRIHRPHYHGEAEILSELAWIEALRRDAIAETPRPLPTRDGGLLARFADGPRTRHAVAFEHMSGAEPAQGPDRLRWHRRIGAIAARLHRHAKGWARPAGFERKRWDVATILGPDAHWGDWRAALGLDARGRAVLEAAAERLGAECAAFGTAPDRFGLVHCDMRAANLLVEGERLGVIDFDDCGFSWFGYDFAASVSFIEHEPIVPGLMAAWLEGYATVEPFPDEQARALPMLVMLRRLQLTAWIASHAETPTALGLGPAYTQGTVTLAKAYLAEPPGGGGSA